MDRRVVIIGAGDHGRSVLEICREISRNGTRYQVVGFLDDAPGKTGTLVSGVPILGGLDTLRASHDPDLHYVVAVASTRSKERIIRLLADQALAFISVIHPSVILAAGVQIGKGTVLNAGAVIAHDTVVEGHSTVNLNASIGHDCLLRRFCTVAPGANVAGRVVVGEGCDIGMNASIAAGVTLGDWSSVGLGSVVIRNVAAGQQMFGNPARPLAVRAMA